MPRLAAYLAELGRALVVEFVPKADPKVRELLAVRDDVFQDYKGDGFEAAFGGRFEVLAREPVRDSGRVLDLMQRSKP